MEHDMSDLSENKRRLMNDIDVNRNRHCHLLMDNHAYHSFSDMIWQTYCVQMMADMDPALRSFYMVSDAITYNAIKLSFLL